MPRTLEGAAAGQQCRVTQIRGGLEVRSRLASLGVLPGALLQVVLRGPLGGPVLVDGARLAIGRRMARLVLVEP
jgi:ferrous iron transport protein A